MSSCFFNSVQIFGITIALVNYLPSQASVTITVTSLDISTVLTIFAPSTIVQGQPFIIEGVLKRADIGTPLEGENISLSYNGISLGTALTRDIEGSIKYQATVQIEEAGSFTLTANFAGSTRPGLTLRPSRAQAPVVIPGLQEITPLVGALAVAAVLIGGYLLVQER